MIITVNGKQVDEEEVKAEFDRLKPHYDEHVRPNSEDASDEQLMEWARENVIERMLVRQAADEEDPISPEQLDQACESAREYAAEVDEEELRRDVELNMKIERLVNRIMDSAPEADEGRCREWYEANLDRFEMPEQVHVRHIVKHIDGLHPKEDAYQSIQEVKLQLDGGEDFEKLASEHSDCPDEGGDLGYFPRGQMVQEFEDVVFGMEVGQISDIFLTQFGYHIARLEDRRDAGHVPFEEVRQHIAEQIAEELRQKEMEKYIDGLREKAAIEGEA